MLIGLIVGLVTASGVRSAAEQQVRKEARGAERVFTAAVDRRRRRIATDAASLAQNPDVTRALERSRPGSLPPVVVPFSIERQADSVVVLGRGEEKLFAEGRVEWTELPVARGMARRALLGLRPSGLGVSADGRLVLLASVPIRTRRGITGAVLIVKVLDQALLEETAKPLDVALSINARLGRSGPAARSASDAGAASGTYFFPLRLSRDSRGTATVKVSVATDRLDAATRRTLLVAGGLGVGVAVLLSLLNALLLRSAVTRPLRGLRDAIGQVKDGDYDIRLDAGGARELRDVSDGFVHMARLVDEHRQRLEALAATDPLTGLANHRHFHEALEAELERARRDGSSLVVIALDLDHFKEINDSFGHPYGDEVLRGVGDRLRKSMRPSDVVARVGGEEFALVAPGVDPASAIETAERAHRAVAATASADGVSCSVGVACFPTDGHDAATLVHLADAALYEAKDKGRDRVMASADLDDVTAATPARTRALRKLLAGAPPKIAFQPIWKLGDDGNGTILGFEALARPEIEHLPGPAEAFEIAERTGRVPELDSLCRRATLARANELPPGALLFLNVAPPSLRHQTLAGDALLREVRAAGLDPSRVVLEITERSSVQLDRVVLEATRLRGLGFKLALDDVGAGNAGLEMLRVMPVDFIKIDREIILDSSEGGSARAVLLAVISYAAETDAFVIAEGIETGTMLEHVRHPPKRARSDQRIGVQGAQGYLLGRPSLTISDGAPGSAWDKGSARTPEPEAGTPVRREAGGRPVPPGLATLPALRGFPRAL